MAQIIQTKAFASMWLANSLVVLVNNSKVKPSVLNRLSNGVLLKNSLIEDIPDSNLKWPIDRVYTLSGVSTQSPGALFSDPGRLCCYVLGLISAIL